MSRAALAPTESTITPLKTKASESTYLYNAPQFPKERCFVESFQASPIGPSGQSDMQMNMSVKHGWNINDGVKWKYSLKEESWTE